MTLDNEVTPLGPNDHAATVRDALSTNIVTDIGARIGYLITRFFIPPFVLAHVGIEAYGIWAAAFILVSYFGISTLGISNVYIKFFAEYSARKEHERANSLLSTGLFITTPVCAGLFGLVYLGWPRVVDYLKVPSGLEEDAREVVLLVVAIFLASIAFSGFRDALTGVQKLAAVQIIWVVAYTVETALIFFLVGTGRGIRGLAEAFLIRTGLEITLSAVVAFRSLSWLKVSLSRFNRQSLRLLFSFGGVVQVTSFIAIVLNSIERAVAIPLVGLESAGLLDVGKKLPAMAASIPSAFASSLVPAASYLQGGLEGRSEGHEKLQKLYLKGARYMNLAAAYVCGLLATVPLPILDVWLGRRYAGVATLMVIFCISTEVHLMTGPGTSILKGLGKPRQEFYYALPNVVALLVFLPAAYAVVGTWTTLGIAVAVGSATVVSAAYFIARSNRILGVTSGAYFRHVILPGVVPYALGLLLSVPAHIATTNASRWAGAFIIITLGVVYTASLSFVVDRWIFEAGERRWFHAVIRHRLDSFLQWARLRAKRSVE